MEDQEKSDLVLIAARWEAMVELLDDKEPTDFMLSFPEVQELANRLELLKRYLVD